jgi:hypothetical protein
MQNGPCGGYGPVTVPSVFAWADYKTAGPSTSETWNNYFYFGNSYSVSHACGNIGKGSALGATLYQGWTQSSCDGRFQLTLQTDGNLVLYQWVNGNTPTAIWWTGTTTAQQQGAIAVMQADGNFVVYDNMGAPRWASNTAGHNGAYLTVQTDGNVVIYPSGGGNAIWASNTCCR